MTRAEAEAHVRLVGRRCRGPLPTEIREQVTALLAEGKPDEASTLDAQHRKGCAADINDVICAGPLDGELHAYECKCGVKGTYGAPLFDELPEAERAAVTP